MCICEHRNIVCACSKFINILYIRIIRITKSDMRIAKNKLINISCARRGWGGGGVVMGELYTRIQLSCTFFEPLP